MEIYAGTRQYAFGACLAASASFDKTQSFDSEPLQVYPSANEQIIQIEDFVSKSDKPYQGFTEKGFVEISKTVNKKIDFSIT